MGAWHGQAGAAGRKDAACPYLSTQLQPGDGLQGPQIGTRLLIFMVISQTIPWPGCCSMLWCTGRMLPGQCPASAQSQWQNEMSGTCPWPGCASGARHSHVPPARMGAASVQPPLLLLGLRPSRVGMSIWGLGGFSSLVLVMFVAEGYKEVSLWVSHVTKLLPCAGQACAEVCSFWGHFRKTALFFRNQNSPGQRRWGQAGTPSAANPATLQPAPAFPNTPSSPWTAPRNIAFPWNVSV